MSEKLAFFVMTCMLTLALVSCSTPVVQETSPPPAGPLVPVITPYQTQTPVRTTAPTVTQAPTPTLPPLPTPTPYLYTVVQGDTMIGIAIYFGITYDELSVANPEINPNFLSVGTQLVIPLPEGDTGENSGVEPSAPELLPLQIGEVTCYPVPSGGMWCYLVITNTLEISAENVAATIRLYDSAGEEVANLPAYSLLNLLSPGAEMPLAAYFAPPVPEFRSAQGQLVGADEANQADTRYQSGEITELNTTPLNEDRLGFQVSGSLSFPSQGNPETTNPDQQYVWVLAIGYDGEGQIVGLRRWEAPTDPLGEQIDFSFQVFSMGRPIESVRVLTESRIAQP